MSENHMERLALRPEEVVAATGLGRTTVYRLIRDGELPSHKLGRAVLVPVEGLKAWLAKGGSRTP